MRATRAAKTGVYDLGMFKLLGGLIIAVVAAGSRQHEEQRRVSSDEGSMSAIVVSADDLERDYTANEIHADELYRGKVLRVTGAVQSIERGIGDDPYLVIWTRNEFNGVQAHFQSKGGLGSLSKGQHVTVRCMGDGRVLGSPILQECVLE